MFFGPLVFQPVSALLVSGIFRECVVPADVVWLAKLPVRSRRLGLQLRLLCLLLFSVVSPS
jgi:hypothetical protein